MNLRHGMLAAAVALLLAACSGANPGPLEGTWTAAEPFPVTVTFRSGEVVAMGRTRKASYTNQGDEVIVTYHDGTEEGTSYHYTLIDADTIRSESGTFRRVR